MGFWIKKTKRKVIKPAPSSEKKPLPKPAEVNTPKQKPVDAPRASPKIQKKDIPKKEADSYDPAKEFMITFKKLTINHRAWDIWRDYVTMFACAISNSLDKSNYEKREKLYLSIIKKYKKQEQLLFPELVAHTVMALEKNPEQDFLGGIFMNLGLGNSSNGQFFTPYHVCELMSKITMTEAIAEQVKEKGYISIADSCCGAGATLIAGINEARRQLEKENMNYQNHVLVVAQDVDMTVALMCYIQISLLGVAGYVKVGNTFTDPISDNDSTENYWFTPMYFSETWRMRRFLHQMDDILKGENDNGR